MKWNKIVSACLGIVCTAATHLWGGLDMALETLLIFMLLDYATGLISAYKHKEISSSTGFSGILKKVVILIVLAVAVGVDKVIGSNGLVRSLVLFFYMSMEGISIIENAARVGVPVPEGLKNALVQLKDGKKKEDSKWKEL